MPTLRDRESEILKDSRLLSDGHNSIPPVLPHHLVPAAVMVKLAKAGKNQGDPKIMAPPPKEVEDSEDEEMSDEEDERSGEEVIIPQKKRQEGYHNSRKEVKGAKNGKNAKKEDSDEEDVDNSEEEEEEEEEDEFEPAVMKATAAAPASDDKDEDEDEDEDGEEEDDSEEEPIEIAPAKGKKAPVKAVPVKAKSTAEDVDEEDDDEEEDDEDEEEDDDEEEEKDEEEENEPTSTVGKMPNPPRSPWKMVKLLETKLLWIGPSLRVKVASRVMVEAEVALEAEVVAEAEMNLVAEAGEVLEVKEASEEVEEEETISHKERRRSLTELNDNPVPLELERCKSPTSGSNHQMATHGGGRAGEQCSATASHLPFSMRPPGDNVNGHCTSPTSQSCGSGKRLSSADVSKVNRWGPGKPPFRKAQSAACMEISLPVTTEDSRENSYTRSRSSSISSIDKDSKEAITALYFMESFARKNDSTISPCLFVGTSLGMTSSHKSMAVGEAAAGKASRSLAQHIPGPGSIEGMKGAAGGVMGELTRARIALDERGQRLGELEEKTAGMMTSAEAFSKHAHEEQEKVPTLTTPIQHSTRSPSQSNQRNMQINRTAEQQNDHLDNHPGPHYDTHWRQASQGGWDAIGRGPGHRPMITPQREAQATDQRAVAAPALLTPLVVLESPLIPAASARHQPQPLGAISGCERQLPAPITPQGFSTSPCS
ncbi:hypothetical protein QTO34_014494 [Cnephaeus nilssonii]|uniref:V-SNARE coiled-coil homology domain-containing protein n=1 Tax=Cnephaeus nilssonii TaxID=3371016 RepID=A0AA40LU43_CNENI|nr:hypothetical protein QTO34_014494 [Eptesicus nilssonii]